MLKTLRKSEYAELLVLFFIQAMAMSAWTVPLGNVLDAHGLHQIKSLAFAATALASIISPLIFGAMADRHFSPTRVLRWLALATAIAQTLASSAIRWNCNPWLVLALIQLFALVNAPMLGISSAIVLARLADAKEFAPVRVMMTFGWQAGCLLVSLLAVDTSALSGYVAAMIWTILAAVTFFLPQLEVPKSAENLSWHERLGLDALTLLKNPDHRVIFLMTTLLYIPMAAFYPYAPANLRDLGFVHVGAWMALAQVSEALAIFSMGWMLYRWRLKWIFLAGLLFSIARFALNAVNTKTIFLIGVGLHGASFALVYITAQIYLDERIAPGWRVRAQSLLSLMNSGIGNFIGYLGAGWWLNACTNATGGTQWKYFWSGLSAASALVTIYFLAAYRGKSSKSVN